MTKALQKSIPKSFKLYEKLVNPFYSYICFLHPYVFVVKNSGDLGNNSESQGLKIFEKGSRMLKK